MMVDQAVEHEAVMGDEDESAGEVGEAVLQHLEGGDAEVVGGSSSISRSAGSCMSRAMRTRRSGRIRLD